MNPESILKAAEKLKGIVLKTPLQLNANLSRKFQCNVYLKREDLQIVRSYKLRGAYNKISSLSKEELEGGVVCASAGNHAQGFAYSCKLLNIKGVIFMPTITPMQKINQTRMFGGHHIEIILSGDTYDDCAVSAKKYASEKKLLKGRPLWALKYGKTSKRLIIYLSLWAVAGYVQA